VVSRDRGSLERYGVSIGAVAAVVALEVLRPRFGETRQFLLLNGAVLFAAWYGGRGPALVVLALAVAAGDYFFLPSGGSLALSSEASEVLGIFVAEASITAALVIAVTESQTSAHDCAARCRRSEEQLRRVNKAHRALSVSTEALVRAEDEAVLLEEICRAVVDVAGYRMCWVGRAEHDETRTVRPVARAGYDAGYVDLAEVTWADTERGRGPVGTAIRTGRHHVHQDVTNDAAFAPWRAEARRRGYASMIALPLRADGAVFGALAIYAAERDAFDADAVRLLTDLGSDLAYGITALRARASVAAGRARFESTLMQAPIAVALYSGPDHVVRLANWRWFALGHGIDEVGKPLRDVWPPGTTADVLARLDEAYASGEPCEVDGYPIPRLRPDSSVETRFCNVSCQPLRGPGGFVTDLVVAISDVTDQVTARRVLEEARAAAERASRAKDEFLRLISHELRTPLTPILGFAEALRRNGGKDPGKLQRGLDIILNNARAEAQIVDDLIDVSKIVAGALRMETNPVELGPIVEACAEEARLEAAAKGVQIEAAITKDTALWGDADRLAQVTRNLLSNAIKFTPTGGRISVEVTRMGDALALRVHDTGVGIPPSELPHVFDPFRTCDASTKRAYGGLGLGLAIVRHIVEAHGGKVWAESAGPGRGATLVVKLPAPTREEADARVALA
jgi:signal transduction histidine kinase